MEEKKKNLRHTMADIFKLINEMLIYKEPLRKEAFIETGETKEGFTEALALVLDLNRFVIEIDMKV